MPEQRRFTGILWHLKWFVIIALLVLIIDLFCVFVLWSPDGTQHLQSVLTKEITLLDLDGSDNQFLAHVIKSFYDIAFVSSGIDGMLRSTNSLPTDKNQQTAIDFANTLRPTIEASMIGLQIFALRTGVLLLSLPFLVIVLLAAISDGFIGWYLRRTGGERESGFIYHRAKRGLAWAFVFLWLIYLVPPVPMNPIYIIPPFLLVVGIATRLHVTFFKKFL